MIENIEYVAWWGAIVSSLVLIWDIVKWMKSGAKVRSTVIFNMHYDDAKLISENEVDGGGVDREYEEYCHIEFTNIGTLPTTLMGIQVESKDRIHGKGTVSILSLAFTPHWGKKLPFVLMPGEIWSCRIEMDRYRKVMEYGKPEFKANFSHLKAPYKFSASTQPTLG